MSTDREVRSYPFGRCQGLELDPIYDHIRENEPLCRVRLPYGGEAWLVTRHEDVRTVLVDTRFSRAAGAGRDEPRVTPHVQPRGMLDMDPPDLTRLRKLVAGTFTARRVERLRTRAVVIANDLIDQMVLGELVSEFAAQLPMIMICELLGVPVTDRPEFTGWASTFLTGSNPEPLMAYMAGLVTERRARPTNDLLGALVEARDGYGKLTEHELLFLAAGLLAAGFETTANQIGNAVYMMLTHLGQLVPTSQVSSAVEEVMRFVPLTATVNTPRWAVDDVELSGGTVVKGEAVYADRSAANRDPRVFRDPHGFDVSRSPNPHIGFGHGIHHCLGAQLARLELQVALSALRGRLPELRLGVAEDTLTWRTGGALRGLVALPVVY
ncbi:cytochrome P450 [Kibdelosporangium philippinense]|uniref:Cytochrome P450 n=1 Tax=Kibdelosporangium philippinense TaxID=211113 RepID=A0ABS8Z9K6_9PSEU|nr:cytochrome P450 [Kibdelosporangium philippinense]MCE7003475.1 cytochrome P450 [Kibdelosporangium philippinense]